MAIDQFDIMCKDIRCKQNMTRPITRKVCRNNCSQWIGLKKACNLGYNPIIKRVED
jgi:hypothetical protein